MKHGKKYIDAAKLIENNKTYDPNEALELGSGCTDLGI